MLKIQSLCSSWLRLCKIFQALWGQSTEVRNKKSSSSPRENTTTRSASFIQLFTVSIFVESFDSIQMKLSNELEEQQKKLKRISKIRNEVWYHTAYNKNFKTNLNIVFARKKGRETTQKLVSGYWRNSFVCWLCLQNQSTCDHNNFAVLTSTQYRLKNLQFINVQSSNHSIFDQQKSHDISVDAKHTILIVAIASLS